MESIRSRAVKGEGTKSWRMRCGGREAGARTRLEVGYGANRWNLGLRVSEREEPALGGRRRTGVWARSESRLGCGLSRRGERIWDGFGFWPIKSLDILI